MKRMIFVLAAFLLASPAAAQGPRETLSGRVEPGFIYAYAFTPPGPGQFLATLSWDSNATELVLILVCTVDGEEISYGVASGLLDRFARLEAGVLPNYPCEIGVMTTTSSANYLLNLQRSQPEPSVAQPPESAPMRRSALRAVIPGSARGTAMERIAFRIERALQR